FLGRQPDTVLREHYARCRALLFPGEEDFGLVPVEAMASGAPVLAYARGGALETVLEGVSGLFFPNQDSESLATCMRTFEQQESRFDPHIIAEHAHKFSPEHFRKGFQTFLAWHAQQNCRGVLPAG
ncbi:MAG: glycosyltransferase, partial [Desulfocurvibacter africanus]